jgi:hypothetical protein
MHAEVSAQQRVSAQTWHAASPGAGAHAGPPGPLLGAVAYVLTMLVDQLEPPFPPVALLPPEPRVGSEDPSVTTVVHDDEPHAIAIGTATVAAQSTRAARATAGDARLTGSPQWGHARSDGRRWH